MLSSDDSGQNQNVHQKVFPAGTVIYFEGDLESEAYVVRSGRVEISRTIEGRKVVLNEITDHGLFGETGIINAKTRMATATTLEETICAIIPRQLIDAKMDAGDAFFRTFIGLLGESLRSMSDHVESHMTAQGPHLAPVPAKTTEGLSSRAH